MYGDQQVICNIERDFVPRILDRNKNEEDDMLAKSMARGDPLPSDVFFHVIGTPMVRNPKGLRIIEDREVQRIINLIMTEDWRAPITLYYMVNTTSQIRPRSKH